MKLRRYRCSTCHKRTGLTFSSLMRHVHANHPYGPATCPPEKHHWLPSNPGPYVCGKCGIIGNTPKVPA